MFQLIGQKKAADLLQHGLETGSMVHAYLFVGPEHIGKMFLAKEVAMALNCSAKRPPATSALPVKK